VDWKHAKIRADARYIGAAVSNQEVPDVTNYVRQTWANGAPATAEAGLVAKARGNTETLMSAGRNDACPKMKAPTIAKALGAERNAIDQHLIRMTDQNMPRTAEQVVAALRAAPPRAANADVINGLAHA
jgi:hypothetical protein